MRNHLRIFVPSVLLMVGLLLPWSTLWPVDASQQPDQVQQPPPQPPQPPQPTIIPLQFPGGPPGGPGGPGFGPMMGERKIVDQFDKDKDGRLNTEERKAAREFLKKDRPAGGRGFGPPGGFGFRGGPGGPPGGPGQPQAGPGQPPPGGPGQPPPGGPGQPPPGGPGGPPFGKGGFGPPGFGRANQDPPKPGPKVTPDEVKNFAKAGLYEPSVLRTLFIDFEDKDWEAEMADFYHTDVEVPATLTVDGKKYPNVGVHFRGASSYFTVGTGYKKSLNVAMDFVDPKQRLYGYKTLNLLNGHDDPTLLSTVLFSTIARSYIPAPKANLVRVVINGESWGVFTNVQQFNKEFLAENFKTTKGSRWKVKGSPGGGGGLDYLGDNLDQYKRRYELKSGDGDKAWKGLVQLTKVLHQTPPDKLEEALKPILDVDSLLWFLALDITLINCDGYWIRASDFSIFREENGRFHIIPHDMNEAFRPAMGPGFGGPGGPGGGRGFGGPGGPGGFGGFGRGPEGKGPEGKGPEGKGPEGKDRPAAKDDRQQKDRPPQGQAARTSPIEIDPLYGMEDARKPLRSKILAVPAFKKRYLQHVHTIAEQWLDWKKLGPVVASYRSLIEKDVETDTHKLSSLADFKRVTADTVEPAAEAGPGMRRPMNLPLRAFAEQRRKYLLNHPEVKKAVE